MQSALAPTLSGASVRKSDGSFRKLTAEEVVARAADLPMVSETTRKMITLLSDPQCSCDEVVKTLRCDNVLTAKLLRLCNSAQTGLERPVASIDQAVLLLGTEAVYRMACTIGFGKPMLLDQPGQSVETNGLWAHSLSTALGAEFLTTTETYPFFPRSVAFTAGLLHDIGKLALSRVLTPKTRAEIRDVMMGQSQPRLAAEKAVLGTDHCEAGACLLRKWGVPAVIVEAAANHHAPVARPEVQLSAVVYLSNCATHLIGTSPGAAWDEHATQTLQAAAQVLGLEIEMCRQLIAQTQEAMTAANDFFHVA